MKNLTYILIVILMFSCSRKEEALNTTADSVNVESSVMDEMETTNEVQSAEYESPMESISAPNESTEIIKQQLQESLNLIILNHKLDISDVLKNQLKEAIDDKVEHYNVNEAYDVLRVTNVEIVNENQVGEENQTLLNFKAETKSEKRLKGTAKAKVTINHVNIDGNDYQNYQVAFDEIILE